MKYVLPPTTRTKLAALLAAIMWEPRKTAFLQQAMGKYVTHDTALHGINGGPNSANARCEIEEWAK